MKIDLLTGTTSTITVDPVGPAFAISVVSGDTILFSNLTEIRISVPGETNRLIADEQMLVRDLAFDDEYVYWANQRREADTISKPGYVVRAPFYE